MVFFVIYFTFFQRETEPGPLAPFKKSILGSIVFKAKVLIKRRPSILDPQGKAVEKGAAHLGIKNIRDTRIGKYIEFIVDTENKTAAEKEVKEYCSRLLSNPIMEDFEFSLTEWTPAEDKANAE